MNCLECGKEMYVKPAVIAKGGGKFCSYKCEGIWLSKHKQGKNAPAWKGGLSFEPYCSKFNTQLKEHIRAKCGRICIVCGKSEKENGKKLAVHHVDYDKEQGCKGKDWLLVPLCASCHSKSNGNREYWKTKILSIIQQQT